MMRQEYAELLESMTAPSPRSTPKIAGDLIRVIVRAIVRARDWLRTASPRGAPNSLFPLLSTAR